MKLITGIFKLLSFVCGVCVYGTVCLIALMGYKVVTTEMIKLYPKLLYPDLMRIIVFIGIMSMVAFVYGRIKDEFWEPTIRVKITKKQMHDEKVEN